MRFLRWIWALSWLISTAIWPLMLLFIFGFGFMQRSNPFVFFLGFLMVLLLFGLFVPRFFIGSLRGEKRPEPWRPDDEGWVDEPDGAGTTTWLSIPNRPPKVKRRRKIR